MKKLIYLYTTGGASYNPNPEALSRDYLTSPTTNRYATAASTDGVIYLLSKFAESTSTTVEIFIDSIYDCGHLPISPLCTLYVVPSISIVFSHISPGDIVFIRGGFRNWLPLIQSLHGQRQNWILYYRANTAHGHWPYWDITLNDLISTPTLSRTSSHTPFIKPVNESIFGPISTNSLIPEEYTFMIGASHIHNKKGQIFVARALSAYHSLFGSVPPSILPGGYIRCGTSAELQTLVSNPNLNITFASALKRPALALAMNRSRFFIHAGIGGQNDRGTLEAMCCGCMPIIANAKSAAPFVSQFGFNLSSTNPEQFAQYLHTLATKTITWRQKIASTYTRHNGIEIALSTFTRLINKIPYDIKPNRELAWEICND